MIHASKIYVIVGSVRPLRICRHIADWVMDLGQQCQPYPIELVDLRDWPLPLDAEPGIPAKGHYREAATRAWSRKVSEARAFVFVTPQYNWGYPAALKNALDHLHAEWEGKPAMIVSYGGHGGTKCAAQLRQVLDGLDMLTVPTMPALTLARSVIEADTGLIDPPRAFAASTPDVSRGFLEIAGALASKGPGRNSQAS